MKSYLWKSIRRVFLCLISVSAICLLLAGAEGKSNEYPVNDKGQTYGPDIKEGSEEPDLILVESCGGDVGYVKAEDLSDTDCKTPEEALLHQTDGRYVDVYLSDGETKIGEFYIGK